MIVIAKNLLLACATAFVSYIFAVGFYAASNPCPEHAPRYAMYGTADYAHYERMCEQNPNLRCVVDSDGGLEIGAANGN